MSALLVLGVLVWAVRGWLAQPPPPKQQVVQQVQIIRPPPPPETPPPPPPPPERVDLPEPEQLPEPVDNAEPPPGEQLGLDAEGTAGSDGFGLVARPGGRDLVGSGNGFAWYSGLVKNEVLDALQDEVGARSGGSYSIRVQVWIAGDGSIERIRLAQSSGDRERDRAIESALGRVTRLPQAPPPAMPQPINLRIVSRA